MSVSRLVSNEVYRVPVRDQVARLRVQCDTEGIVTFRAEPGKGDADEAAALAAVEVLKGYLEARGNFVRSYYRRHRNGTPGAFNDVLDAVSALDMADQAEQLLRDFQLIAASRIH